MHKSDVVAYFNGLSSAERRVLGAMRKQILQLVPELEERLSRGVPFFYYRSKRAVGYRASKNHLSFFIMEGKVLHNLRDEIADFDNSSTVIRFTAEKPLPEKLVKQLVCARIAEIENTSKGKSNKGKGKNSRAVLS